MWSPQKTADRACFKVNNLKSRVIILKVVFKDKNTHAKRPLSKGHKRRFVQNCAQRIYKAVLTHSAIVMKDSGLKV